MRRAWIELMAVILTGAVHLVFEIVLDLKAPFILGAGALWLGYAIWRLWTPGQAREWGMRADTLRASLAANGVFFGLAAGAMTLYGVLAGRGWPSSGFYILLALYPVWGWIQQFLLCSIAAENLRRVVGRPAVAAGVAAVLFGIVHAPDWGLCALTAAAGAVWTAIYLRWPNLWVQGIAHGWMGAAAYFLVLGIDPWEKFVESLERII